MYDQNLKKIRFELKMSARELAEKLNVSAGSIQNYETKKREPNYNFMLQLCEKLNINLNWFCTGQGPMFNAPQETSMPADDKILKLVEELIEEKFKQKGL